MEIDFLSMVSRVLSGHTLLIVSSLAGRARGLCVSLIYIKALISLKRLHPYNSISSQRPHLWMP